MLGDDVGIVPAVYDLDVFNAPPKRVADSLTFVRGSS